MGSERVKTEMSRPVFIASWVLAGTLPAILGYATGYRSASVLFSPYLVVVAVSLGVLQGLVLERSYGGGVFWKWLVATIPCVIAAPYLGVMAGLLFWYAAYAAQALLHFIAETDGSPVMIAILGAGIIGGGAPVVLAQWLVLRRRVGRRWLWTLPVPGLTYGTALLFAHDNSGFVAPVDVTGLLTGTGFALVYGVVTAMVLATAIPARAAPAEP